MQLGDYFFAAFALFFSLLWARSSLYLYEHPRAVTAVVLRLMANARVSATEAVSLAQGLYYAIAGLVGIVSFAWLFGLELSPILHPQVEYGPLILLGIVSELSLTALLVRIYVHVNSRPRLDVIKEVESIPWLRAVLQSPVRTVSIAIVLSAMIEEVFFRGVLMGICLKSGLHPIIALGAISTLFLLQQLLQVRTKHQAVIIGSSSVSIGLVGGLLVIVTRSVIPAAICHAAFVVFYVGRPERRVQDKDFYIEN